MLTKYVTKRKYRCMFRILRNIMRGAFTQIRIPIPCRNLRFSGLYKTDVFLEGYKNMLFRIAIIMEFLLRDYHNYVVETSRKTFLLFRYIHNTKMCSSFIAQRCDYNINKKYALSSYKLDDSYVRLLCLKKSNTVRVTKLFIRSREGSKRIGSIACIRNSMKTLSRIGMCLDVFYKNVHIVNSLNNSLSNVERFSLNTWVFRNMMRLRKRSRKYFSMSRRRGAQKWYNV
jgi:hypothetical protein